MEKTKFTIRIETEALERAKRYARQHGTSVTRLVSEFFRSLDKERISLSDTPILDELSGTLSAETPIEDYHKYLESKYLEQG